MNPSCYNRGRTTLGRTKIIHFDQQIKKKGKEKSNRVAKFPLLT
jgi:hypothetical protein